MMNYIWGLFLLLLLYYIFIIYLPLSIENLKASFNSSLNNAEKLQKELWAINRINLKDSIKVELSEYKFFTQILEYLLKSHRQLGVDIFGALQNLKDCLGKDIIYEKKLIKIKKQAFLEIGIIFLFSLLFLFSAKQLVDIDFPLVNILIIITWQFIGAVVLYFFIKNKQKQYFNELFLLLSSIYQFHALGGTSIAINELIERIGFDKIQKLKKHQHIINIFNKVIYDLKHYGLLEKMHLDELLQCVNNEYNEVFESFEKTVKAMKLLVIMLFSVISYLFTMYSMMQTMII